MRAWTVWSGLGKKRGGGVFEGGLIHQCTLCHERKKNNVDKDKLKQSDDGHIKFGYGKKLMKLRKMIMRLLSYELNIRN